MTPEQLKWNDKQWAAYLGCAAPDVIKYKQWITENYIPYIALNVDTHEYVAGVWRRSFAPSGSVRYMDVVTMPTHATKPELARAFANEQLIPGLEFMPKVAQLYNVPPKILQMLHMNQKQR